MAQGLEVAGFLRVAQTAAHLGQGQGEQEQADQLGREGLGRGHANFDTGALGLAITRHLVELHGGTITAISAGEDQGATFRVEIPMIAVRELREQLIEKSDKRGTTPVKPNAAPVHARLDGLRILAVDDHADALSVVERVLTRAGAELRTAPSVADALSMVGDWMPDCIISDIGMPGEDGYSFIRKVRELPPPLRNVPAIALTAFARESDRELSLKAGFNDHLSKPVDTGALLQKIASLTHRA